MLNHMWWLKHFLQEDADSYYSHNQHYYDWTQVAACYAVLVWTVPLGFVAVSTTTSALPMYEEGPNIVGDGKQKRQNALGVYLKKLLFSNYK